MPIASANPLRNTIPSKPIRISVIAMACPWKKCGAKILYNVRGRIRRRECDRDNEVSRYKTKQHKDRVFALQPAQQRGEHCNRALATRTLHRYATVHGQCAEQCQQDED